MFQMELIFHGEIKVFLLIFWMEIVVCLELDCCRSVRWFFGKLFEDKSTIYFWNFSFVNFNFLSDFGEDFMIIYWSLDSLKWLRLRNIERRFLLIAFLGFKIFKEVLRIYRSTIISIFIFSSKQLKKFRIKPSNNWHLFEPFFLQ